MYNIYNYFFLAAVSLKLLHIPYDIPNGAFQASCLIFVWAILKKYHMTKDEISDSSALDFRSNWTVVLVTLLGLIITLGIGTIVSILVIIAADVGLLPMTDSFVSTLEEMSAEGIIFWR